MSLALLLEPDSASSGLTFAEDLQSSISDPVFLFEISPSDGSVSSVTFVPFTLGLWTLGTLPYKSAASGTVTFYYSDRDWTEGSYASTRQNVHYEGRCSPPQFDRTLPVTPEAGVRSVLSLGTIEIDNSDTFFDTLVTTYAVDGRTVNLRLLPTRHSKFADSVAVFSGVGVSWNVDKDKMNLKVREASYFLDVPLLGLFGGTGGADGTSSNQGQPIPQVYGLCRNITAALIDPTNLIYRFHDRTASAILAVYDRGAPITAGSSYASFAALLAATTAAGHYDWCLSSAGSFYKLGSSPSGTVTADVRGDAESGYVSTAGAIIKTILLRGTTLGTLNTTALAAVDTALPGEMGIYFNSQLNFSGAIDEICTGTFTFWGDIGDGLIGAYQFTDPTSASPKFEFNQFTILDEVTPVDLPDAINPVVWRRRIAYQLNWTPMVGTDIVPAPTITDARRKQLQDPDQLVSIGDASRQVKDLLAVDAPTLVSLFDNQSDATALGNTLLALYSPGRRIWSVPVGIAGYYVKLNDVILLQWPRFGLTNGLNVRVIGLSYDGPQVTLTVFG